MDNVIGLEESTCSNKLCYLDTNGYDEACYGYFFQAVSLFYPYRYKYPQWEQHYYIRQYIEHNSFVALQILRYFPERRLDIVCVSRLSVQ